MAQLLHHPDDGRRHNNPSEQRVYQLVRPKSLLLVLQVVVAAVFVAIVAMTLVVRLWCLVVAAMLPTVA